jgi:hypothetical protein
VVGYTLAIRMARIRVVSMLGLDETITSRRCRARGIARKRGDATLYQKMARPCRELARTERMLIRFVTPFITATIMGFPVHAETQPPQHQSAVPSLTLDALSATRDRPLFSPDRRKPPAPAVADIRGPTTPLPRAPQKPQLTLIGIIVTTSETFVLLRDSNTS